MLFKFALMIVVIRRRDQPKLGAWAAEGVEAKIGPSEDSF